MQDLNDLRYFAAVADHGGFAPAGRALKIPKSKLSRRITALEERLGVRLLERSTRRFRVTEVGWEFHRHCTAMLAEAEAAESVIARVRAEPRGLVRLSCPSALAGGPVAAILPGFLAAHPRIQLQLLATNRRIDLIEERVDVAIRVRSSLEGDATLVMRGLGRTGVVLVASPALLPDLGDLAHPDGLSQIPTLGIGEESDLHHWTLHRPADGSRCRVAHRPRLGTTDFDALLEAAYAGLGVALLPDHVCAGALQDGRLQRVLPDWVGDEGIVHLVFTARRGLLPAVRALVDHLVAHFPPAFHASRQDAPQSGSRPAAAAPEGFRPPASGLPESAP